VTNAAKERISTNGRLDAEPVLAGAVCGFSFFRMKPADAAALRRRPGPVPDGWSRIPPSLLRYSDEQTVAGTTAVFTAIDAMGRAPEEFEGWGVVAASRFLGRAGLNAALRTFLAEGVWGTSPHLIPHFALHSPSGTISLALGLHGPNLGVGGGLHAAAEGFLAALTWLAGGVVPGVWLVLSGWVPELAPDRDGNANGDAECQALALALVAGSAQGRAAFRVTAGGALPEPPAAAPLNLVGLAATLHSLAGDARQTIATDARGWLRVELVSGSTVSE
jgi:hypothetical protein